MEPELITIVEPPVGVPKNWQLYRSRFVEPLRIRAGVAFWQAHEATLLRAQAQTGVPAEIIAGVIGVENHLRPAHGQLPGAGRAGHAGV